MTRIILDKDLRAKLGDLKSPLELCDESGNILAQVYPVLDPNEYDLTVPELSEEELERRRKGPFLTTAEVLARLEKL